MIKKCINVTSHPLYSLVTNCHTFSDPLPSSVTYFMNGPKEFFHQSSFYISLVNNELIHQSSLYLKNITASISTTLFAFFPGGKVRGKCPRGKCSGEMSWGSVLDPCSCVCAPAKKRER